MRVILGRDVYFPPSGFPGSGSAQMKFQKTGSSNHGCGRTLHVEKLAGGISGKRPGDHAANGKNIKQKRGFQQSGAFDSKA